MNQYDALSEKLVAAAIRGGPQGTGGQVSRKSDEEIRLQDILLQPKSIPAVVKSRACSCDHHEDKSPCEAACLFDAIKRDENNNIIITGNCTGCSQCIRACPVDALTGRKDTLAVVHLLQDKKTPVFAMIAPAFCGQLGADATPGKLRSAFKQLGFYGMVEVALFADILTLKEALEFDRIIQHDGDYVLTSCCCPLWLSLIRKSYQSLISHVPPSVSPMIACGRSIKKLHPEAKTVFIGPCLAKKAEAREPDIADAVDYVLTFDEVAELFTLLDISLERLEEDQSDHASKAGRIYARTSGVSEAVQTTLDRLRPDRKITLKALQADGVLACKALLADVLNGKTRANFIEGMGCKGGCVGGPRALIDRKIGCDAVNSYGDAAKDKTPVDNPHVFDLLHMLGYETVESLLDRDSNFTRTL